jgi:hypothetical protein
VARRKIESDSGRSWELKAYEWRGRGEKSALTGKEVRPFVAVDTAGKYHAGLRNWSYYANGNAGEALYHHAGCASRAEAISRAQGMCKEWVAAHRELAADMKRAPKYRVSAAAKYGSPASARQDQQRELRR